MDNKSFTLYLTAKGRALAASRGVRGVFRRRGQGLQHGYTATTKRMQHNPSAQSVVISGAVSGLGRMAVWHAHDSKWSGDAAAALYRGPVIRALRKAYPKKRKRCLLEDNDPTGYRSRKGLEAKAEACPWRGALLHVCSLRRPSLDLLLPVCPGQVGISVFAIPPRSPDLSVMDYSIWSAVLRHMREEEATFPKGFKESRDAFLARLQKTAKSLPKCFILKSIGDMRRRCERLFEAKGGLFEEGGSVFRGILTQWPLLDPTSWRGRLFPKEPGPRTDRFFPLLDPGACFRRKQGTQNWGCWTLLWEREKGKRCAGIQRLNNVAI